MPKINFNIPLLTETGEEVTRPVTLKKKLKPGAKGQIEQQYETDADGHIVLEPVRIKDLVVQILAAPYEGDEKVSFSDRAKRGKLARKVATSSTANYRTEELNAIQELAAKAGSTTLLAQIDDLINGPDEAKEEAEDKKPAADATVKTEAA